MLVLGSSWVAKAPGLCLVGVSFGCQIWGLKGGALTRGNELSALTHKPALRTQALPSGATLLPSSLYPVGQRRVDEVKIKYQNHCIGLYPKPQKCVSGVHPKSVYNMVHAFEAWVTHVMHEQEQREEILAIATRHVLYQTQILQKAHFVGVGKEPQGSAEVCRTTKAEHPKKACIPCWR